MQLYTIYLYTYILICLCQYKIVSDIYQSDEKENAEKKLHPVTIPALEDILPESCGRWKVETVEDHVGHPTAPHRKNVTHHLGIQMDKII